MSTLSETKLNLPPNNLIQDYFDQEVKKNPSKIAICFEEEQITYQELAKQSKILAAHMQMAGIRQGDYVGIYIPMSPNIIIAMLATLRLSAVYVPLDYELPSKRLQEMIIQCHIRFCICQHKQDTSKIKESNLTFINIDTAPAIETFIKLYEKHIKQIAYVNFSSGSTGQPKAIACTHLGVIRLFKMQEYIQFSENMIFLQAAPVYFDAATFEIWGALLSGGTLIINGSKKLTVQRLAYLIRSFKINTAWLTSSLFDVLVDADPDCFRGITQLIVGGDIVSPKSIKKLYSNNSKISIINGYGPTENTTFTCCYPIPRKDLSKYTTIPIGKPLNGTEVYILNENVQPSSVGELHVAGHGLAAGYVQKGKIVSTDKFYYHEKLARWIYKTGDYVQQHSNGVIEFKGRIDNQIKLNGYRIELEEIESTAKVFPLVKQAICLTYMHKENKYLLLFIIAEHSFPNDLVW